MQRGCVTRRARSARASAELTDGELYVIAAGGRTEHELQMKVISPMPSKDCKRGSLAIARGHWQAVAGSPRGKPPDHGQFAAVLALVKDRPSATLKKRRP